MTHIMDEEHLLESVVPVLFKIDLGLSCFKSVNVSQANTETCGNINYIKPQNQLNK